MNSLERQSIPSSVRLHSRRGGVLRSALFLGLFFLASLALFWMVALPRAFEWKFERDTGCDWSAEQLACNPFGFELRVDDAVVGNSDRFGGNRPLMKVRSLRVQADFKSLLSGRSIFERADLEISRIALVVNESGALNLEELIHDLFGERLGFGDELQIRYCRLKVDTVEILDFSGTKPSHTALRLGIDEEGFQAKGAIGLFEPMLEIARRADYLPERKSRHQGTTVSASRL